MSSSGASSCDSDSGSNLAQRKHKSKGNKKSKGAWPTVVATPHSKNEGANPDWDFKPPEGAKLAEAGQETDEFDWDILAEDDNIELWIMRVPDGIKPKNLDNLKLDAPSGSASKSARMGSLARKSATYDVWSIGDESSDLVGAEEVKNLSLIVPRRKKHGSLLIAPQIPTRHIVLSARAASPCQEVAATDAADISWKTQQNPPRPSYPKEMLKHQFIPFGSLTSNVRAEDSVKEMIVDEPNSATQPHKSKKKKEEEEGKPKKRKVEGDGSTRKAKKSAIRTA